MSLGMVMQLPEEADETSVSRSQLLAKLDVCMGGRVAEELIFGEQDVTTGASSDLEQVCRCTQVIGHRVALLQVSEPVDQSVNQHLWMLGLPHVAPCHSELTLLSLS